MRTASLLLGVVVLVLVLSMLCVHFLPSTEDFMTHNDMWNGVKRFCDEFGAVTIDSLDDLPDTPAGVVLVLIPYIELDTEELAAVGRFVGGGGTLLLMDDYGYGNQVLSYLGLDVRFSNQPLFDPLFNMKNLQLPRITDFTPEVREAGIDVIVLNHATALLDVLEFDVIAWSSVSSFLDTDESETWEEPEPRGPFPVAAQFPIGDGEVVVVADPSIVINSIVGRDDNYAFIRCLTSRNGQQQSIFFTTSHLPMASLDVSKTRLDTFRPIIASPAGLLGTTALVFIVVSRYALKKGGTVERY
ncbi:MAG: DUF4350 domain-containing protein [Dehalococcoidales bacterium]|nr:DUF4350 domain-containing protein [Dehalococcoidales bacterium]